MGKFIDLTGNRFGRLVATHWKRVRLKSGISRVKWFCSCDCGEVVEVLSLSLRSGNTRSCGCLQRDVVSKAQLKLGMSKSKVHRIWTNMKQRCTNPKNDRYNSYGGRGIRYDPKWETFEGFWEDMGEGYEDDLSLERIDVNDDYRKSNCKWIPLKLQARNRRKLDKNSTGKTGVSAVKDLDGNITHYKARWSSLEGKQLSKSFSFKVYGEGRAFRLACEYRDEQIRLLNEQGAGYRESHGE